MEKEKPKAKSKSRSLENDLMNALHFTEADLDANRDGQITERQAARLRRKRSLRRLAIAVVAALVFLINLPGLFVIFGSDDYSPPADILICTGLIFGCIGIFALLYTRSGLRALTADLQEKTVEAVQGQIKLEPFGEGNIMLRVVDRVFSVSDRVGLAFKNGDPYCLYYAPHSKILLSAEWLRED